MIVMVARSGAGGADMVVGAERVFIGAGCNRIVNNVSWGSCDLLSFGAQNAVAIFSPKVYFWFFQLLLLILYCFILYLSLIYIFIYLFNKNVDFYILE